MCGFSGVSRFVGWFVGQFQWSLCAHFCWLFGCWLIVYPFDFFRQISSGSVLELREMAPESSTFLSQAMTTNSSGHRGVSSSVPHLPNSVSLSNSTGMPPPPHIGNGVSLPNSASMPPPPLPPHGGNSQLFNIGVLRS